jgi:regulator of sigma E protease
MNLFFVMFFTKLLPFFYALIGFGLLITIHECGHFLFCKLFGIHTPTFSIGMGPTIFQKQFSNTNFRLAMIPIGGYVEIAGMAEVGQGEQAHAHDIGPHSFRNKPYWQRFLVLSGGVLFNLLFAYGVFSALYVVGMPIKKEVRLVVSKARSENKEFGNRLHVGDVLVGINDTVLVKDPKKMFPQMQKASQAFVEKKEDQLILHVKRGDEDLNIRINAEQDGNNLARGIIGGASFGIDTLKVGYEKYPFFQAIRKGVQTTHHWIAKFVESIKSLAVKRNLSGFGGPVMIISQSFKLAKQGLMWLLVFLAIISINLAIINLLPIGALDGGQLLFETIEAIIRRRIPEVIRFSINLASWILIMGLILFLSYQDILALILR